MPLPLAGVWHATFWLDSLRNPDADEPAWIRPSDPTASVQGTLTVLDSQPRPHLPFFESTFDISFSPLLGREMSCFRPDPEWTMVAISSNGALSLGFTPLSADCGFSGLGWLRSADLADGTWKEQAYSGTASAGHFVLHRAAP